LLPFESCNLGSINVAAFVRGKSFDYARMSERVRLAVHFLDNIIDANRYPLPQIADITRANRKIGLGVMGFADALIQMAVPYDSWRAVEIADDLMSFIEREAIRASVELAKQRGAFPNFAASAWHERGRPPLRNATVTAIAPTGTISIIAGCSSGIEPLYAVSYIRRVLEGAELVEVHPLFQQAAVERGFLREGLLGRIAQGGLTREREVPDELKRLFVTAYDVAPEWHVRMQAAFQRHCDNAVSKTVNLPSQATPADVAYVFRLAYALGCKGITVYRDGSRKEQVLSTIAHVPVSSASGVETCPDCTAELTKSDRCAYCVACGWSRCG
jgi:ribonucleoside-diphosphate reductase alpha chain